MLLVHACPGPPGLGTLGGEQPGWGSTMWEAPRSTAEGMAIARGCSGWWVEAEMADKRTNEPRPLHIHCRSPTPHIRELQWKMGGLPLDFGHREQESLPTSQLGPATLDPRSPEPHG